MNGNTDLKHLFCRGKLNCVSIYDKMSRMTVKHGIIYGDKEGQETMKLGTSFIYYGYDKNTYQDCKGLIHSTNFNHIQILNIWFILDAFMFLIFSRLNIFGVDERHTVFYAVYFGIALTFAILLRIFKKSAQNHSLVIAYLEVVMFMTFCIQVSEQQPYLAAVMFPVILVVIALSFIDTMLKMGAVLLICGGVFLWRSNMVKPPSISSLDNYNTMVFLLLALILHYTFQRARMKQFETFQKNVQIARELEVKSSFDVLTSLLNRGRFFSMASEVLRNDRSDHIAVCLLDLDSFKQINDKLGHQMGDKAIQIAGKTIADSLHIDYSEKWSFPERAVRERLSFAGRLGGDEFIVFIRSAEEEDAIRQILQGMLDNLNRVELGELHGIHASFGVTVIEQGECDIDAIYSRADDALYESKRAGKNQITFS